MWILLVLFIKRKKIFFLSLFSYKFEMQYAVFLFI